MTPPRATYRLQFNKNFGFREAARIAPYLARLGVSHVYASPWLKARPGSTHGYDIVDHHSLNPELGSQEDFDCMVAALRENGLRQILDFVPNHMGVGGADNPLWLDVLEWGPESAYAGWFDIDWQPDSSYLRNKLLLPFLGNQYGVELYSGKLALKFDAEEGSFSVWAYGSHKFPVCPFHYGRILGDAHPDLERLGDAFANLREWWPQVVRRATYLKRELAEAAQQHADVREAINAGLADFNGIPGNEDSWRQLDALINAQYWRAAHFRVAADDINYRRFFDINDLAGLRMELPDVFDHAHALVLQLLAGGILDGLRIDHVDGLLNPKEYLQRLRAARNEAGRPFYLVVEKIVAKHERLREDWPVDGTTGYEFASLVTGLLIDSAGEEALTRTYIEFTGQRASFAEVVRQAKLRIMRYEMASELNVLATEALRVAHQNPKTADLTHNVLRRAIREVVACFPVYRTYVDTDDAPTDDDRRDLNWAVKQARANENSIDSSVFDFVYALLSGDLVARSRSGFSRHAVLRCAMKLQQYSGPVMAKGLEDTAFYRYNRFVALNEVGGHPDEFGVTISKFHNASAQRAGKWPDSLLSTSTHDTKRGEDTRARLAVLSEIPDDWARHVEAWSRMLRARHGDIEAAAPPDRNDEYLFYQLLVGTLPVELTVSGNELGLEILEQYAARLRGAMLKSIREAKVHSTWAAPNPAYEEAVLAFVDAALDARESRAFLAVFLPFVERVARLGVSNSLVQTALKLTAPGVPDIYQGADLWDLSLVDPDNRRPVDYSVRIRLLDEVHRRAADPAYLTELLERWPDGAIKLFVTTKLLQLRSAEPDLFALGTYEPLAAAGPKADYLCAFARRSSAATIVVIASRFPARLEADPGWRGTSVSAHGARFRNVLTGADVAAIEGAYDIDTVLGTLPVAVLQAEP